jgi:hypothetical protein
MTIKLGNHKHANTPNIWDACFYCGVSLDGGCPPEEWTDDCPGYTPEKEERRMAQVNAYIKWHDQANADAMNNDKKNI